MQNIPAVMKYKISVTIIQKSQYNKSIGHDSSLLTDEILVPNCSKAQDQENLHYQWSYQWDESINISYSDPQD